MTLISELADLTRVRDALNQIWNTLPRTATREQKDDLKKAMSDIDKAIVDGSVKWSKDKTSSLPQTLDKIKPEKLIQPKSEKMLVGGPLNSSGPKEIVHQPKSQLPQQPTVAKGRPKKIPETVTKAMEMQVKDVEVR